MTAGTTRRAAGSVLMAVLLMFSFNTFAQDSEIKGNISPIYKYPDLRSAPVGMQPVIGDEAPRQSAPAAPPVPEVTKAAAPVLKAPIPAVKPDIPAVVPASLPDAPVEAAAPAAPAPDKNTPVFGPEPAPVPAPAWPQVPSFAAEAPPAPKAPVPDVPPAPQAVPEPDKIVPSPPSAPAPVAAPHMQTLQFSTAAPAPDPQGIAPPAAAQAASASVDTLHPPLPARKPAVEAAAVVPVVVPSGPVRVETVSTPQPAAPAAGTSPTRLLFTSGAFELDQAAIAALDRDVLPFLAAHKDTGMTIRAFAAADPQRLSGAKRLALSRALFLREYLINRGVSSARIDVQVLGADTNIEPKDRIDILFSKS